MNKLKIYNTIQIEIKLKLLQLNLRPNNKKTETPEVIIGLSNKFSCFLLKNIILKFFTYMLFYSETIHAKFLNTY